MNDTSPRHVVVVGLMGSGKTTIGRRLAGRLGWPLRDSDAALEAAHGRTAREIAASDGVARLHELEREQLLAALAAPEPSVIAAAASTIEDATARAALGAPDIAVVWLRGSPGVLASRQQVGRHRPDLGLDPTSLLAQQSARRGPLFASLNPIAVDVDTASPDELTDQVLERLDPS